MGLVLSDNWDRPYSREKAVYPVPALRKTKFWPTVSRVDDGEFRDGSIGPCMRMVQS